MNGSRYDQLPNGQAVSSHQGLSEALDEIKAADTQEEEHAGVSV
jgi:hypothetical protein